MLWLGERVTTVVRTVVTLMFDRAAAADPHQEKAAGALLLPKEGAMAEPCQISRALPVASTDLPTAAAASPSLFDRPIGHPLRVIAEERERLRPRPGSIADQLMTVNEQIARQLGFD